MMINREKAMKWWNELPLYFKGCKHHYADKYYPNRGWQILTGREIEIIWNNEKNNPIMEARYICSHCGSDNVQVKAWVKPNDNYKYVGEVEGDELGWCDDCQLPSVIDTVEMNVQNKVIGFQVDLDNNDEMHPDMSASFCVYSLPQVNKMIEQDKNRWSLLAIYEDTIEEPTMMFKGDPRNPDEPVMKILLDK